MVVLIVSDLITHFTAQKSSDYSKTVSRFVLLYSQHFSSKWRAKGTNHSTLSGRCLQLLREGVLSTARTRKLLFALDFQLGSAVPASSSDTFPSPGSGRKGIALNLAVSQGQGPPLHPLPSPLCVLTGSWGASRGE